LLLARLIQAQQNIATDQALFLAGELAHLLDQMKIEEVPFAALNGIVPADLAGHWQEVLTFLAIVSEHWPRVLQAEGVMDAAERRSKLLDAQATLWSARPPADPIVAAGSTGTVPATARLLRVVGRLPEGCVVLPGLDTAMPDSSWDAVDATHPQFAMKQLLAALGVARAGVDRWPAPGVGEELTPRVALLAEVLKPAVAWAQPNAAKIRPDATRGLYRLDCANPEEEARAIALALREALETPGRTAALVTPDRKLARRVTAELGRWAIAIDDSAGTPLSLTGVGTFLRLTATMIAEDVAPVPLLAALKHPLAAGGMDTIECRRLVRRLDRRYLRGPRPAAGFAGLRQALAVGATAHADDAAELLPLLERLERLADPFVVAVAAPAVSLADLVRVHVRFAEALAANSAAPDAGLRLWSGDDGEAAALWLEEFLRVAEASAALPFTGKHYPMVLTEMMAGVVVRPRFARHPRLHIWGPLEARLQQADVVVLGGLNEGTWPGEVAADAWMSRPMRAKAGLPPLERRVGLAAHDFAQAAAAPTVLLTRATKVDGVPTVPSRWLDRLAAVLKGGRTALPAAPWQRWQAALVDAGPPRPLGAPAPTPPVERRPRTLSATRIETWVRDPYAIYARYVLDLRALDSIDADPSGRDRGKIVHAAVDAFLKSGLDANAPDAVARIIEAGRAKFADWLARPGVWAFWWPRFQRAAAWLIEHQRSERTHARLAQSEVKGIATIAAPAGPFRVEATADRIDRLRDGGLAVIDYKTGGVPSTADVAEGFAPQLPIEGMIAEAGGFEGVAAGRVMELLFWKLSGVGEGGESWSVGDTPDDVAKIIADLRTGLGAFVAAFDDAAMPYRSRPRPEFGPRFSDYDHLARVREWSAATNEDDRIALVPLQAPR
jgi:ATP-dependent helicase/nuclease subunit B